ncbi:hypothetical protein HDC92_000642 [Pedobacter sp. AK017]|uniref:hypothetical protein n=1 Tax=Pedobacter sp. AK017 TaxID=2723073 RepID=UPI0018130032|nr:hypothetical protein [Pedobacter sp. AK017]MBB5436974.1 hypothetical protein [Pedobacter sp. AK017]
MDTILFILIPLLIIVLYFILRGNSKAGKAPAALSATDRSLLLAHVHFYRQLQPAEKFIFENKVATFLSDIRLEALV